MEHTFQSPKQQSTGSAQTFFFVVLFFCCFFLIYTFTHLKQKNYNHQGCKYQCTWDPSKKGLNKEQRMIISENIS